MHSIGGTQIGFGPRNLVRDLLSGMYGYDRKFIQASLLIALNSGSSCFAKMCRCQVKA